MPIVRAAFLRTTSLLLLAGFAALVAIIAVNLWLVERSGRYFDDVMASRNVRAAAVAVRNGLQNLETGQRGYLLTGEEPYLQPYEQALRQLPDDFRRLDELQIANRAAMQQLQAAIDQKIAETRETIDLRRQGRTEEAVSIVQTDRGKALMDETMALLENIIAQADRQVADGVTTHRANTTAQQWVTTGSAAVILLVVGAAVWLALSYLRELMRAREETEKLNQELEARVGERTEELRRANEEVQRFAYIVTHDLRAPLVNIMGFTAELDQTMRTVQAYVLADEKPLSEQEIQEARTAAAEDLPEAIGFIRSSTRKMDGLINAILKISRDGRRPLTPETIDLSTMIQATADSVQHQVAETGGEIVVADDLPTIVGDKLSLEQIFGNLIDNAVKYRAPDRPVRIDITGSRMLGGRVRVEVKDNGRGIDAADHQRVFDLFRRSGTQDQPGEGIGLAHVRSLVRNLGGDISLSSEFGRGSIFTVLLPSDFTRVIRSTLS